MAENFRRSSVVTLTFWWAVEIFVYQINSLPYYESESILAAYTLSCIPSAILIMAERRADQEEGGARIKRQKVENGTMDPKSNPYLAHMYDGENGDDYSNGYGTPQKRMNGSSSSGPLANFVRHKTTAAQAKQAEDSGVNPFNGQPTSKKFFSILRTRRDLPVHTQRYTFAAIIALVVLCAHWLTRLQR